MQRSTHHSAKLTARIAVYSAMTLAVVGLSIISILLVLGYQFDPSSGQISQGALLQLRSIPSDASVSIDEKRQSFRTPGKTNIEAGLHSVGLSKTGYHDWRKSFTVGSGRVLWLNYPRLIPTKLSSTELRSFEQLAGMIAAPNREWLAIKSRSSDSEIMLVNVANPKQPRYQTLRVPASSFTSVSGVADNFRLLEWDFGSRYVLVEHTAGQTRELLRVDRNNAANTVNISQKYSQVIDEAHFAGTSGERLVARIGGGLYRLDLEQLSLPPPIVIDVTQFVLYENDTIAYVSKRSTSGDIGLYKNGGVTIIRSYDPRVVNPVVSLSEYFGDVYVAMYSNGLLNIARAPERPNDHFGTYVPTPFGSGAIDNLSFSSGGRFALLQQGKTLISYDIENSLRSEFQFAPQQAPALGSVRWLDDYYLYAVDAGQLRMSEFDGTNAYLLGEVLPASDVTLSRDGKYLFSIGTNPVTKKPVLRSTSLTTE